MKKESLLLKIILFLVTLAIIAGWGFGTYGFTIVGFDFNNHYAYVFYNLAVGVFAAGIFLLITSYLCFHLLLAIDKNQFYSSLTSTRLAQISHLFVGISVVAILDLPALYVVADHTDAPGILLIGIIFAGVAITLTILTRLFSKLVTAALTLTNEEA